MDDFASALLGDIRKATEKWRKQNEREIRDAQARARRRDTFMPIRRTTVQEAAWAIMETAYLKASANGTLPARPRQIMYAARGYIQAQTGKRLDDRYFTQTILPDFCALDPDLTSSWDIVWDARGTLVEPHTAYQLPLGTLEVRDYLAGAESRYLPSDQAADRWHTLGSTDRYGAVLFVEKEGFLPLFRAVKLAERYDLAIMSTKGVSTTAARELVDHLITKRNVPVFVIRDFDVAGFTIAGTLRRDTRRFNWKSDGAEDLGLRLADAEAEGLEAEEVYHRGANREVLTDRSKIWAKISPQLVDNGATKDEIEFLCCQRVELNAFPSDQLVRWIERKLDAAGVTKVRPEPETLAEAARHFARGIALERRAEAWQGEIDEEAGALDVDGLGAEVDELLAQHRTLSWDDAVRLIVCRRLQGKVRA
jgi:hypothetical protein